MANYNSFSRKALGSSISILAKKIFLRTTQIDSLVLADGFFEVNNFAADSLSSGGDMTLSHVGVNNGIADTTVIGNITTPGTMTFAQLYSSDAMIFSDGIGGVLDIVDGRVGLILPGRLDLNINGLRTRLDSLDKLGDPAYDFWMWTIDGNYSLTSHSNKVTFPRYSSERLLAGYDIFLPHCDNAVVHQWANSWLKSNMPFVLTSPEYRFTLFGDSLLDDEESEDEADALSKVLNDLTSVMPK